MRCTRPLISKDNFLNNLSFKQHKLLYFREQRHKTAILQNLPLSRIPEPGNIHWDGFIPHCTSVMPNQTKSTGSHSRKMLFAEIPVPFYLIISDCHASRHNPLLHTFTGNNEILAGTSSHEMGLCHPFIPAISIDR